MRNCFRHPTTSTTICSKPIITTLQKWTQNALRPLENENREHILEQIRARTQQVFAYTIVICGFAGRLIQYCIYQRLRRKTKRHSRMSLLRTEHHKNKNILSVICVTSEPLHRILPTTHDKIVKGSMNRDWTRYKILVLVCVRFVRAFCAHAMYVAEMYVYNHMIAVCLTQVDGL